MRPPRLDSEFLRAALLGYEIRRKEIDEKIAAIQEELKGAAPSKPARKRKMSATARRRIAAAGRKRWAAQIRRSETRDQPIAEAGLPGDDPTRPH